MKKMIAFAGVIILIFAAISALTYYENKKKAEGNPYQKENLHSATVEQLDDPNYQNIILPKELKTRLENEETLTVYFYQPTCPACKRTSPIVVPMTESMGIDLKLFNLIEFQDGWKDYNIESTPTIVHYENGKEVKRIVGLKSKPEFEAFFKQIDEE